MGDKHKSPNIAIIGAGFSGLCTAIQLQSKLKITSFTLYEECDGIGGTWFQNTYPGCECDIPSYIYSFSFEPNPSWTKFYPGQNEILDYLKNIAKKHQLYEKIKFQHKVLSAEWNETSRQWIVKVCNLKSNIEELRAFDMIVIATGAIRAPNQPKIFQKFLKTKMHSAEWKSSTELNGKIVAVVGTGASAAQIISSVVDKVKKTYCLSKTSAMGYSQAANANTKGSSADVGIFPWKYKCIKKFSFLGKRLATWHLNHQVGDVEKRKILSPIDDFGCKRVLMSNTYYMDLNKPHVTVITSEIVDVSEDTIFTKNGSCQKLDVLITATGFKTQEYFAPLYIKDKNGENLNQKWQSYGPRTYLGIVCHSAPNAFFILGPNSILAHNSTVAMIEYQVDWMIQVVEEMMKQSSQIFMVKSTAQMEYMEFVNASMKSKVWGNGSCTSWYTNNTGDPTILWPETLKSYYNRTRTLNLLHFHFE